MVDKQRGYEVDSADNVKEHGNELSHDSRFYQQIRKLFCVHCLKILHLLNKILYRNDCIVNRRHERTGRFI